MKHLIRALISAAACLITVVSVNFILPRLMPGDPVLMLTGLGDEAVSESEYEMLRNKLSLDDPLPLQFARYASGLIKGDLGYSYHRSKAVSALIKESLPNTLLIALPSIALSSLLAMLLALKAGSKGGFVDFILTGGAIIANAVPGFLVGMILITVFAYKLRWLPFGGLASIAPQNPFIDRIVHLALPVAALSLGAMPSKYLILRNQAHTEANAKYVLYARARGLSELRIMFAHIFPNISQAFVAAVGLNVGMVLSGSLIIESLFSIRGMGQLMASSISSRDFPAMQGCLFVSSVAVIIADIITQAVCIAVDPKLRAGISEEG